MARYRYAGPGPAERDGRLVRPGDVWEFPENPDWGRWEPEAPEAAETPAADPATQSPVDGAASQPAADEAAPAAGNGM